MASTEIQQAAPVTPPAGAGPPDAADYEEVSAVLAARVRDAEFRERRLARTAFNLAQSKAQSLALKQRKDILRSDLWLEQAMSFAGGDTV